MNCVCLFLLLSLEVCLNFANKTEMYQNFGDKVHALEAAFVETNHENNAKSSNQNDLYNRVNENNKSDIDTIEYASDYDAYEMLNENGDVIFDNNSYSISFFTYTQKKQNNESEWSCDDCFPGLLKSTKNKNKNDTDHDNYNVSERHLATKFENKSADDKRPMPITLLYRQKIDIISNVSKASNNTNIEVENIKPKKPFLRIVNGRAAALGDVPYQVAFKSLRSRMTNEYVTFCGGTIIGPKKLVTAAHCFEQKAKKGLCQKKGSKSANKRVLRSTQVVAGNLRNVARLNDGGQWRRLRSVLFPIRYHFPNHDIAVGYVTIAFVFNAHVNQIPYEKVFTDRGNKICLASGYGRISPTAQSDKLLLADLTLKSNAICSAVHRRNMRSFICTDSVPSDIHKGDSGGPLVCSGLLVGVVSGNRRGAGSFFTRVSSYSKYIARGNAKTLTSSRFVYYVTVLLCIVFSV